jgi:beta-1,4-mannosyltransferase
MTRRRHPGGPIIVMHTTRDQKDKANPYTLMLMSSMPGDIKAVDFRWTRAVAGKCDVVHLHWPELLLRDSLAWKRVVRKVLFTVMYLRWAATRMPIVETVHNISPHEPGSRYERKILSALSRRTTAWIKLNPVDISVPAGRIVEIPHGHYRDWFKDCPRPDFARGRYLFFGLIRPYKNVEGLIDAFTQLNDPDTSLRIVGASSDPAFHDAILVLQAQRDDVSAECTFVSDWQLAEEIGRAELVVLPYKEFYNSGAALLALSLGRPVLTPRSRASELLQDEFGKEWVLLYSGPLSGADLKDALQLRRALQTECAMPDLSQREWMSISDAHAKLYRSVSKPRRG